MFLPNTHSFLLVRSAISRPTIHYDIQSDGQETFLPNERSFSLARSAISRPTIRYSVQSDNQEMFLPNEQSFLLVRPVISRPGIQSGVQYDIQEMFLPNEQSFLLARSAISRPNIQESTTNLLSSDSNQPTIGDTNKRSFLKVAGIAGAGIIASQLLPNKAEALIMGSSPTTGVVGVKNIANAKINPATEETVSSLLKASDLTFDGGSLAVKVTGAGSSSFSDSGNVAKSGLVDADRHMQVDVVSSALPTSASTETTLQTLSFGGFKFALRMATSGNYDYVGEAAIGSTTASAVWRVKRIDNTSGIVVTWANTGVFDQVWNNYATLTYS